MPDQKRRLQNSTQTPFPGYAGPFKDKGKVLLEKGTRHSVGNEGELVDMDHLMEMLNINLRDRMEKAKAKPKKVDIRKRQERLSGLFGGRR